MSGIAGIAKTYESERVQKMLRKLAHRGLKGSEIVEGKTVTMGVVWHTRAESKPISSDLTKTWDARKEAPKDPKSLASIWGSFAVAAETEAGLFLARDTFGVRPLYYGYSADGALCYASEVKALLEVTRDINEFPERSWYTPKTGFQSYSDLKRDPFLEDPPEVIARELFNKLEQAVSRRIEGNSMGSWLSGGLDSSAIVALARPHLRSLHTFAGGLLGASDLEYARQVAETVKCYHHEILLTEADLIKALPQVIYSLESFDALLVRSTIVNYLVSRYAKNWVDSVFSGEGGDELFAGYAYLEQIPEEELQAELLDITSRLHNTALQRVDRSAHAHGLIPHVPFLDADLAAYVMRIPPALKRGPHDTPLEKWILRKAMEGRLPKKVLWRRKAKFWEGAGVGQILSQYADAVVSNTDFVSERLLPNGWQLNTKEELMYYRIYKEYYGQVDDLAWIGRTKGAPSQAAVLVDGS